MLALVILLTSVIGNGASSFQQTYITLPVELSADRVDKRGNRDPVEMAENNDDRLCASFARRPLSQKLRVWV